MVVMQLVGLVPDKKAKPLPVLGVPVPVSSDGDEYPTGRLDPSRLSSWCFGSASVLCGSGSYL
jgi:hypothetical protein